MNNSPAIEPCRHVRKFVERQAMGSPRRWWDFAGWLHLRQCRKCQQALKLLRTYLQAVAAEPQDSPQDHATLSRIKTELATLSGNPMAIDP